MSEVKLTIGNVFSTLEGKYDEELLQEVLTCYPTPKYFQRQKYLKFKPQVPKIRLLRNHRFPTGLLSRVLPAIENPVIVESRVKPKSLAHAQNLQGITLRLFQKEAADKALEISRGVIVIPFAGGKTFIGGEIIDRLGLRSIYLVHRKELMYDVVARFKTWMPDKTIGLCGDGILEDGDIMVAMILSAKNLDLTSYDVMIGDECHHVPARVYFDIFEGCTAYYRIGLTGTVTGRSDGKEMLLHAATGDIIYQKTVGEMRTDGFVSDAEVIMLRAPYKGPHTEQTFQELEEVHIVNNVDRNSLIKAICAACSGSSILIFVRRVHHGEILRQIIPDSIFVHGGTSTVERLEATKETNKVVISTSIFEEGIDAPQFDVIINAAGGKAAIPTSQRVGRGMRLGVGKKLRVFDFYDADQQMLQRHSYYRSKVYKNLGFEVKKYEII